jgi:alpha-beta hydrolase superfamily lysophospholipase
MKSESSYITLKNNQRVFLRRWMREGPVRAIVHISHGMAEHSARYARLAERLTGHGALVYAHDHRGHGYTSGQDQESSSSESYWEGMASDLTELIAAHKLQFAQLPVFLLGHSMGAMLVRYIACSAQGNISGIILSGTGTSNRALLKVGRIIAGIEKLRLGAAGKSEVINALSFGSFNQRFKPVRTPFDWLSRDSAEVDQYIADDLCGFVCSVRFWMDFMDGLLTLPVRGDIDQCRRDMPVLLLTGECDPVTGFSKGATELFQRMQQAGFPDAVFKVYPQARHEILNEINREEVMQDVIDWINAHIKDRQ